MQIVVDFLLEYYVWILAVLGILLITVIGFLADTKKKKKMREKVEEETVPETNVNQYPDFNNANLNLNQSNDMLNMNNNFNMSGELNNNMMNSNVNQEMNINTIPNQNINNDMNNFNVVNPVNNVNQESINPINNINPMEQMQNNNPAINTGSNDSFFVPASEQTPSFASKEVVIPKPVEPTPVMNNNSEVVNSWGNIPTPVVEPAAVPNVGPAPVEVPQAIPTPEPVLNQSINPISNEQVNYNINQVPVTPATPGTPVNTMPSINEQTPIQPQMTNPTPGFVAGGSNFVVGNQTNITEPVNNNWNI